MTSNVYQKAFNKHFEEFVEDVQSIFPDNKDVLAAQNAISLLRKGNPSVLINIWNTYIVLPYASQIAAGDIDFFIHKDYSGDIPESMKQVTEMIDRFRQPVADMDPDNQQKCMKYIQNLTQLTQKHFGSV